MRKTYLNKILSVSNENIQNKKIEFKIIEIMVKIDMEEVNLEEGGIGWQWGVEYVQQLLTGEKCTINIFN